MLGGPLYDLYKADRISIKSALTYADSSTNLEWKINFGGGAKEIESKEDSEPLEFPAPPADIEG